MARPARSKTSRHDQHPTGPALEPQRQRAPVGAHADIRALQRKAGNRAVDGLLGGAEEPASPIVEQALQSGGQPLDPTTRSFMEERFGQNFDQVRVHTGAKAAESAEAVSAKAYTVGRDVVFGAGEYQPETGEGKWLLAHELTHVVQQMPGTLVDIQRTPAEAASPAAAASAAKTEEEAEAEDADIEALDLAATAKAAAKELKKKHPGITFTSGRRNVADQAHAMASNIVSSKDRKWIEKTYISGASLQKWVDDNPKAVTVDDIAKGLVDTMKSMAESELGKISKHYTGEAFDVQPQVKDADAIKKDMRALSGLTKFMEKEGGLVRWHAQFKKADSNAQSKDPYEQEADRMADRIVDSDNVSSSIYPAPNLSLTGSQGVIQRVGFGDLRVAEEEARQKTHTPPVATGPTTEQQTQMDRTDALMQVGPRGPYRQYGPGVLLPVLSQPTRHIEPLVTAVSESQLVRTLIGGFEGEWNENPTYAMIGVDTVVSLIPIVDQICDARDLSAHLYFMLSKDEYKRPMRWIAAAFSLIGVFPVIGSAIKGASKFLVKGTAKHVDEFMRVVRGFLPSVEDLTHFQRMISAYWAGGVARGIAEWNKLLSWVSTALSQIPAILVERRQQLSEALARVHELSPEWLTAAFAQVRQILEEALASFGPRLAGEGGGDLPPNAVFSQSVKQETKAAGAKGLKVEDLRPQAPPATQTILKPRRETVEEFKARGGNVMEGPPVKSPEHTQVTQPSERPDARPSREDVLGEGPEARSVQDVDRRAAGLARKPRHHVFPQEHRKFFRKRGFDDIDDYCVELDEAVHQAVHGGGNWKEGRKWAGEWNNKIMSVLEERELALGRELTKDEIIEIGRSLMRKYKINRKFVPFE